MSDRFTKAEIPMTVSSEQDPPERATSALADRDQAIETVVVAQNSMPAPRTIGEVRHFQQTKSDFRQLAESIPGIVWTATPRGVGDFASRELLERCGMTLADLMSHRWHRFFHPDDQDLTAAAWWQAITSGNPFAIDARLYCKHEDDYRWHALQARPIRDGSGVIKKWLGNALDIHEERRLREELEQTTARLERTLDSITDGLLSVDHDWRIRYFNREAERVFQMPRDQVIGELPSRVLPWLAGGQFERECARAMACGRTQHFEVHLDPIDLWLEIRAYPAPDGLTLYFCDIGDRKRAEAEIEFLAFRDPLTNLPNRRCMLQHLEKALRDGERCGSYTGLMLVDLDNFKRLNDTLGHETGDDLVVAIARQLEKLFADDGMVARIGGDEFALVLTDIGATSAIANRRIDQIRAGIFRAVRDVRDGNGHGLRNTCSIGADIVAPGECDAGDAMKQVDLALLGAKQAGGNQFRRFDHSMRVRVDAWAASEIEIPRGMLAGEFVPYYQPKLDAAGRCIGAEALIRWHHPERGLIEPDEFVPLAEQTGLIKRLGKIMLHAVCADIADWSRMPRMRERTISINVSASHLHEADFVNDVAEIIEQTGAPAGNLQIEVTETMLMADIERVAASMDALRQFGVTFALDDFGTGYSALAYLKRLPLQALKIDQGFVRDIVEDASSRAIIQTIVALAASLGMDVLAEGVETWSMRDHLLDEGCGYFQGYLFGHPMPADDFVAFPRIFATSRPDSLNHSA